MSGPSFWKHEKKDLTRKYHWAATEHPLSKTLFAWEVSSFYGEKKDILDMLFGL